MNRHIAVGLMAISVTVPAFAQRSDENVILQADDAFGATIGRESIGIYNSSNVRGFSPISAGNARIAGLYYDQVWGVTRRLRQSTNIRVGLSAQGFAFPAPTGVVDYSLRRPGDEALLSTTLAGNSFGGANIEVDFELPLAGETLSFGGGIGLYKNEFGNDTDSVQHIEALNLRWRPSDEVDVLLFGSRSDIYDDEIGPIYIPAGEYLPPRIPRHYYLGPQWADYEGATFLYGGTGLFDFSPGWRLEAGVFRSAFDNREDIFTFVTDLDRQGNGRYTVFADPPRKVASTSGEVRLSHYFSEGPRTHTFSLSARGRSRSTQYGGSDFRDFGPVVIGEIFEPAQPQFTFGELSRDRIRQAIGGIAYHGRWADIGELSIGVSRTDYRKTIRRPGLPLAQTDADPWLYNVAGAIYLTPQIALYGGYARGLEDNGTAPQNAVNRNQALPALITRQYDAGLRWRITDDLSFAGGVFDLRKPYFTLDANNLFTQLGTTRSRGIEFSLSGSVTPRLSIVVGGVLLDPEVTGEAVTLGRTGSRPVGLPKSNFDLNVDWRVPVLEGLSIDAGLTHQSRIPATVNNAVFIPERTLVSLGGRYRFRLGGNDASVRLSVSNLFDAQGFDLRGPGAYDIITGRQVSGYLVVDF